MLPSGVISKKGVHSYGEGSYQSVHVQSFEFYWVRTTEKDIYGNFSGHLDI